MEIRDALAHVVAQALSTVAGTANLSWEVKRRILKAMGRLVRRTALSFGEGDEFIELCRLELEDILSDEDVQPLCRFQLAAWFAGEVAAWLSGTFDDAAD